MANKHQQLPGTTSDLVVTRVDVELDTGAYYACGFKSSKQVLAITGRVGAGDDEQSLQAARRIAACLSACDGIETEVLEFFTQRMQGSEKKADLKDVADKDASVLSAANKAIAITVASDVIAKARESSRQGSADGN